MTRKIIVAVAIGAFACGLSVSSAAVKHHDRHHVAVQHSGAHAEATAPSSGNSSAEQIQGVNPMTNSPAIPPAPNKQPYVAIPGVNPM
jgi:hypothetical protein